MLWSTMVTLCNGITLHGGWCLADLLPGLQTTLLRGPSKNQDLLMKALKEKKLNAALETRGAMGQPVKLPAETWTKTNKSDFEK